MRCWNIPLTTEGAGVVVGEVFAGEGRRHEIDDCVDIGGHLGEGTGDWDGNLATSFAFFSFSFSFFWTPPEGGQCYLWHGGRCSASFQN